jgi:hypothetical protein
MCAGEVARSGQALCLYQRLSAFLREWMSGFYDSSGRSHPSCCVRM